MRQYRKIKGKYPNALVLFRLGDFYEAFNEDAVRMAEVLDIALTKRSNGGAADMDLAGFPYHALDTYLPRLVKAGLRIAICDQLCDPKEVKGLVPRGVTEVVTPGVAPHESLVEPGENQFLASIIAGASERVGLALVDMGTGEFLVAEGDITYVERLLTNFSPKELLVPRSQEKRFNEGIFTTSFITVMEDWSYGACDAQDRLCRQFQTQTLKGFGVEAYPEGIRAAGATLAYLELTKHDKLPHIQGIARIEENHFVWLDRFTLRNLEVFSSQGYGGHTLVQTVDRTLTPMGERLLRRWLAFPLRDPEAIAQRHAMVEYLVKHDGIRTSLEEYFPRIGDLERLASRAAMGRIIPREVVRLAKSLQLLVPIQALCCNAHQEQLQALGASIDPCEALCQRLLASLVDDPPNLGKGEVIARGVNKELDEFRTIQHDGHHYLSALQQKEAQRTGISSLKIGFNNVFGYYFEVRNTYKNQVPSEWVRKQTLVQAERYINNELKALEEKIIHAQENIERLEVEIFHEIVRSLVTHLTAFQRNATTIAQLDGALGYARVALEKEWVRPEVNDSLIIDIEDGWHPVIADVMPVGTTYVPNSIHLDPDKEQILMITGPNMSGKSALLRQTALIVLLAQAGSFVPAKRASIGYVDKVFTRVGATDNISQGESTFMVEMTEAASILNNLSARSLLLLDEIGRGTSTYDGISIAWAMAEFIHDHPHAPAKTLFATHYHELNEMASHFPRMANYHVSVREVKGQILFTRKLKKGGVAHSLGIHVARLAGMPPQVVQRAQAILQSLESQRKLQQDQVKQAIESAPAQIFPPENIALRALCDRINALPINSMTPLEALNALHTIQKEINALSS